MRESKEAKVRRIKKEAARICRAQRLRALANPTLTELDRLLKKAEQGDRDQQRTDKVARYLLDF